MTNFDVYAAGLVDGEGCIYLQDSVRQGRRMYYPIVEIGMASKAAPVLTAMRRHYGGRIYTARPATERWSEALAWKAHGQDAVTCLTAIRPHLMLKAEQCRMALLCHEIRMSLIPAGGKTARWTEGASARCATLKAAIQELNQKGPGVMIPIPPIPGARHFAHRVGDQWVTDQGDLFSDTGWASFSGPWPASGMGFHGEFWTLSSSESPSAAVASSLPDVLETGPHLRRYFLSPKAAAGILRRARNRGRELPEPLRRALEAVASAVSGSPRTRSLVG